MNHDLIQLFDNASSTFTYFLVDRASREAVAIDSVDMQVERDLALVRRLDLRLRYVLETHAHADHITGAGRLREATGALAAAPIGCGIVPANLQLNDGDELLFGVAERVRAIHTPGHTAGSMSYLWRGSVFTGDALLIDGCGRTDFQSGDAGTLFDSIHGKLFALPVATRVYPGHDYRGNNVSTIGWEKRHNARLAGRERAAFIDLMNELHLPRPKMIDVAVPANQNLGIPHAV
jgi:glyoxylase-like metal-dependent hydrolase (beta-lactamase superfamily II)